MSSSPKRARNFVVCLDATTLTLMPCLQFRELLEVHLPRYLTLRLREVETVVDLSILLELRRVHTVKVAEVDGFRHLSLLLGEVLNRYAQNPRRHLAVRVAPREKVACQCRLLSTVCGDSKLDLR